MIYRKIERNVSSTEAINNDRDIGESVVQRNVLDAIMLFTSSKFPQFENNAIESFIRTMIMR